MPLTDIQRDVVVVLKQFRTPHTYVAGGAVLNHNWLRLSDDLMMVETRFPAILQMN